MTSYDVTKLVPFQLDSTEFGACLVILKKTRNVGVGPYQALNNNLKKNGVLRLKVPNSKYFGLVW